MIVATALIGGSLLIGYFILQAIFDVIDTPEDAGWM